MQHESKCRNLHGHRYAIEASFVASSLDSLGRVIDFGVIKDILGEWINENWDHNVILHQADKALGDNIIAITKQKIFYLSDNPTAENMAFYLINAVCPELFKDYNVKCTKIKLYETPNCYTEVFI